MKNRLRIIGKVLSTIVLIGFQFSCEDNGGGNTFQSLLDGQIEYTGTFPAVAPVAFTTKEGETLIFDYAYPGFLILITDPSIPLSTISSAVEFDGGNIVDAIPKAGLYVVQVEQGQEDTVLSTFYDYSWFRNASPLFPIIIGARLVAIDYFVPDGSYTTPCGREHGQHVADIMGRSGDTVREVDMCGWLQCPKKIPPGTAARLLVEEMESAYAEGEQVVINLSLQSEASGKANSSDKRLCSSIACKEIRKSQLLFLMSLFQAVEEQEQYVADNTVITICAGNAGVELDHQLQALQDQYKKASKRIKIVGGLTTTGTINYNYNTSSSNMVFARSRDVSALGNLCKGTSFASPEVARILGYIWEKVPGLTSEQLMIALDNALEPDQKIPQDPATGWTTQYFLNRAVIEAAHLGGFEYTLVVGKTGTGSGSVSVSSDKPGASCGSDCYMYKSGTVVTLIAKPDEGSEFTGWTGACPGTGSCVVTMNATDLVSANFDIKTSSSAWIHFGGTIATLMEVTLDGDVIKAVGFQNIDYNINLTIGDHSLTFFCSSTYCFAYVGISSNTTGVNVSPTRIDLIPDDIPPGVTKSFTLTVGN